MTVTPEYSNLPQQRPARKAIASRDSSFAVWLAMLLVWCVLAAVVLAGMSFFVGVVLLPPLGPGTPFVVLVLLILLAGLLNALRRRRRSTVVAYLEQAVRLNLPLPAILRAAERSEGRGTARALRRLRVELEAGQSVHDALAYAVPGTPVRILGLVGSAERSGGLPRTLARLTHEATTRFEGPPGRDLYLRWYPLTLALVVGGVVSMISVFVMPKIEDIFLDFKIPIPRITHVVMDTWQILAVPLGVVLGMVMLVYVARLLAAIFAPESHASGPLRWFVDRVKWYSPVLGGAARWRALGDTCHVLADALDAGHPLDWALVEASRSGTNDVLAERLALWADEARAGQPAADAAVRAEIPPLLVGMFRTGMSGGTEPAQVFRFLARYYDGRFARASVILQAMLVPAMAIVMGAIVCSIIYALYVPMIQLIDQVSSNIWSR
jgi:type II secretory pathway component PulF